VEEVMGYYSINYDLVKNRDYEKVKKGVISASTGTYAKILESFWIIESNKSCSDLRDYLKGYIDSDDKLFVIPVSLSQWASFNIHPDTASWLKEKS
jgi:hypothetical protein